MTEIEPFDISKRLVWEANKRVKANKGAAGIAQHTRAQFAAAEVARISLGSALASVTHRVLHDAATAMFRQGDFSPLPQLIPDDVVDALLSR